MDKSTLSCYTFSNLIIGKFKILISEQAKASINEKFGRVNVSDILLLTLNHNSVFPFPLLTKPNICYDQIVFVLVLWERRRFFVAIPSIYPPYKEYHFLAAVHLLCLLFPI